MTTIEITCCDYCNPNLDLHPEDGRGLVVYDEQTAIKEFSWKKTKDGIKCQDCQEDEEATKSKEEV